MYGCCYTMPPSCAECKEEESGHPNLPCALSVRQPCGGPWPGGIGPLHHDGSGHRQSSLRSLLGTWHWGKKMKGRVVGWDAWEGKAQGVWGWMLTYIFYLINVCNLQD